MPRTKKKVKPIVKTKVISARVTEAVYELLHQQAEDAGMTLSEFTAQMLMKGRVNTSYMQSTGKKYADHAATLRSWSARKRKQQKPGTGIPDYTYNKEESL